MALESPSSSFSSRHPAKAPPPSVKLLRFMALRQDITHLMLHMRKKTTLHTDANTFIIYHRLSSQVPGNCKDLKPWATNPWINHDKSGTSPGNGSPMMAYGHGMPRCLFTVAMLGLFGGFGVTAAHNPARKPRRPMPSRGRFLWR